MEEKQDQAVIDRFKSFRKKHIAENQNDAAKLLGITPASLSYIENGKRSINYKIVSVAVNKYGMNPVWLSSGKGAEKKAKEPQTLITDIAQLRQELELQHNVIEIMRVQIDRLYKELSKD